MQKDVVFQGILAATVSLLFIYVSAIEIPFYRVEADVQKVAIASLAISVLIVLVGLIYERKGIERAKETNFS